jgi:hypothetical protein
MRMYASIVFRKWPTIAICTGLIEGTDDFMNVIDKCVAALP